MKPCNYLSESIVLVTPAVGSAYKAKLVTEYGYNSTGGLIVVSTRYVDTANEVITLAVDDEVEVVSSGQPVTAQKNCIINTEQDLCVDGAPLRMVTEYGFNSDGGLIVVSTRYVDASNEVQTLAVDAEISYGTCQVEAEPLIAPGALLSANVCVGTPILIPFGNKDDKKTIGTGGDYATLAAALADPLVVDGTILTFVSDVTDTLPCTVNRAVVIDLAGFKHTNATTTVHIGITAPLAVVKNGTIHHAKTANTSIETVINIDASGPVFVFNNTIKVQEFGVVVRGAAYINENKFEYVGASQTNSHRFIAIYKISGETKIDDNEFLCSTIPSTTRYSNFVFIGSTAGSSWTAPLYVTRNRQTGGSLRQFVFNESLVPTAGAQLIVAANSFNDFNGGIGLISPAIYNGLDKIVIVDNDQGADATGNFKGVFFVDGTGTLDADVLFEYGGNTTAAGPLRADYVSLASDTDNIVARKNTITAAFSFKQPAIDEALEQTGLLLQDIKGRRTYIVDSSGNPVPGFGTEDDPYVVGTGDSGLVFPEGQVCYDIAGDIYAAITTNGVTIWKNSAQEVVDKPDLTNAEITCCTAFTCDAFDEDCNDCGGAPASGGVQQVTDEAIVGLDGLAAFTLTNAPIGSVQVFLKGIRLPKAAVSVTGNSLTYLPTENNNNELKVGDRITFDYIAQGI